MQIFIVVCVTLVSICAVVLTVYLVQTLVQLRRTARSIEILTDSVQQEADKVGRITSGLADVAGVVSGSFGKTTSVALNVAVAFVRGLLSKFHKDGEEEAEVEKERPAHP